MADQAMRLTQGTTTDGAGSPLTGVTDPDAAAGWMGSTTITNPASETGWPQAQGIPQNGMSGQGIPQNGAGQLAASLGQIPSFFGYLHWFDQQKPPPEMRAAAQKLIDNLDAAWQTGGSYHPMAHSYDLGQFLHDVALVAAAQHTSGQASPAEQRAHGGGQGGPRTGVDLTPKPAAKPANTKTTGPR